jgi:hypothetical protein
MPGTAKYIVRFNGIERRLFYIREQSDGSLTYIPPKINKSSFGTPEMHDVKEIHFSGHVPQTLGNPKDGLYHIKETILTEQNLKYTRHAYVHTKQKRGQHFIWAVASSVGGETSSASKSNKTSESIKLIAFTGADSIAYTLYFHDPVISMPEVQGFSKVLTRFTTLSATIYMCFLNYGSLPFTIMQTSVRSPLRGLGEPERHIYKKQTMSVEGVEAFLHKTHRLLGNAYMDACDRMAGSQIESFIPRDRRTVNAVRWPEEQSLDDMEYGILSRLKNELKLSKKDIAGFWKVESQEDNIPEANIRKVFRLIESASIAHLEELYKIEGILPVYHSYIGSQLKTRGMRVSLGSDA